MRRSTVLEDGDRVRHAGLPTTSVSFALVGRSSDSTTDELARYLDRAVMLGRYDAEALALVIQRRGNFRGRHRLLGAIATLDASSGRFRSEFERRLNELIKTSTMLSPAMVNVIVEPFRPTSGSWDSRDSRM